MSNELQARRVAFLVANDGVEQVELTRPWQAIEQHGGTPVLIAPEVGKVQGRNHLDEADAFEATVGLADATVDGFDALVLPGGVANPDDLRARPEAVHLIRAFAEAGKPIAAICHAPWTLIDAGLVKGRRITSWPSLRTDLTNAGAEWVDEEVVVSDDGRHTLVTSRNPDDLDAFCREVVRVISARPAPTG
ncbi:MAG: type 1 glutamine amidotransferase domain-containing protein [Ilumatobacteraceae bacterium]